MTYTGNMNYSQELEFAKGLAREAGIIMKQYFRVENNLQWKSDNTPLTIADTTINSLVINRVKAQFPKHGIIGEEESYESERDYVWVVDPIDGTMPYSIGIPLSMFSLALVERKKGTALVAVAYDPQLDTLYSAHKGKGAFLNDQPILTSPAETLKGGYTSVLGGIDRISHKKFYQTGKCADLVRDEGARVFTLYSHVYAAVRVASGELLAASLGYGSPWDSAACSLIVQEAGGIAVGVEGKLRRYDEWGDGCLVVANQVILDKMLNIIQRAQ